MNYKIQSVKIIRTWRPKFIAPHKLCLITLTPYMVLPLFATRFADYAGGIRVSFI